MKPYSKESRGEVFSACDRGRGTRELATYFNVGEPWLRGVKQVRREFEALWTVCGDVLDRFTKAECRNCFQHRGCRST